MDKGSAMMERKRVLFTATVVKQHIMTFHIPYLRMFQEMGWETAVAGSNDYEDPSELGAWLEEPDEDEMLDYVYKSSWAELTHCEVFITPHDNE